MKCQLLMTGNELMTGVTIETNSAWIAEKFLSIGIGIKKKVVVGDNISDLENEILDATNNCNLLIINGGLGPTIDDLTAQALANVCRVPLINNDFAEIHVRNWCQQKNISVNAANLKQTLLPESAHIIPNAIGSAVGIRVEYNGCLILCTPGVPSEMQLMIEHEILPDLKKKFSLSRSPLIKRLQIFGMGESTIQQKINVELADWPTNIELGFRAGFPTLELKLTVYDPADLPLRDLWEKKVRHLLGNAIFGENNDSLASVVMGLLQDKQKHITTAESCTGGQISAALTAIAGSSKVFEAGFITYSNEMKHRTLGVDPVALHTFGAVSEEVVRQMAQGALQQSHADYVIAVSGIAGPDGGSTDKPVGTVWIAWGSGDTIKTRKCYYPAERKMFQTMIVAYGLDLIRRELLGITEQPRYFR